MKFITLLFISCSLFAGGIGWEWALFIDGKKRTIHKTFEGCEAFRILYKSYLTNAECKQIR